MGALAHRPSRRRSSAALDSVRAASTGIARLGDWFGLVDSLHELGRAALELGDLDTARASCSRCWRPLRRSAIAPAPPSLWTTWRPRRAGVATMPARSGSARSLAGAQGSFGGPASSGVRRPTRPPARCPCRDERGSDRCGVEGWHGHGSGGDRGLRPRFLTARRPRRSVRGAVAHETGALRHARPRERRQPPVGPGAPCSPSS